MNISLTVRGTTFLRIGIAFVIIWFGVQQFIEPAMWVGFIPNSILKISPVGATTLVHLNGALEVVFGTSLMLGLFTRASALILALHMADITYVVGYNSIGVRDFGLMIAVIAVLLNGADYTTLDQILFFKAKKLPD
jgi:uncharacterized membrane protein YphA (DoxX/SURF4 family)